MVVSCEQVWQEVSNYLDDEVETSLHSALEDHIRGCPRCTSVVAGTRNVIQLYSNERLFQLPMGFSWRLQRRLADHIRPQRGTVYGWLVAAVALALIAGSIGVANWRAQNPSSRSEMAQRGHGVPANLLVIVSEHSRLFHIKGCPFVHQNDNPHVETAAEAMREGYVPCVRCLGEYVSYVAVNFIKKTWAAV
ncbi:MAG: zf-HC2 domain-containing protein [Acidobacteriia bacterium]|nr:zf-HC2 domain-containing protein [Terriglobia bacterium]